MTPPVTSVWFALYSLSRRRVKFCCGKLKFSQPAILCRSPSQPCLEFPSRSLLSQTTLRCRLVHLRIILLSTLLTFVTKSFGFLSLTTELETLRARSPFGLDSALQKIRLPGLTPFGRVVRTEIRLRMTCRLV